jgi:hypothetical protein
VGVGDEANVDPVRAVGSTYNISGPGGAGAGRPPAAGGGAGAGAGVGSGTGAFDLVTSRGYDWASVGGTNTSCVVPCFARLKVGGT